MSFGTITSLATIRKSFDQIKPSKNNDQKFPPFIWEIPYDIQESRKQINSIDESCQGADWCNRTLAKLQEEYIKLDDKVASDNEVFFEWILDALQTKFTMAHLEWPFQYEDKKIPSQWVVIEAKSDLVEELQWVWEEGRKLIRVIPKPRIKPFEVKEEGVIAYNAEHADLTLRKLEDIETDDTLAFVPSDEVSKVIPWTKYAYVLVDSLFKGARQLADGLEFKNLLALTSWEDESQRLKILLKYLEFYADNVDTLTGLIKDVNAWSVASVVGGEDRVQPEEAAPSTQEVKSPSREVSDAKKATYLVVSDAHVAVLKADGACYLEDIDKYKHSGVYMPYLHYTAQKLSQQQAAVV